MVVKILSSSSTFNGVSYNTNKTEKDKGELMKVANFGYLEGFTNVQPQEYKNYLIFHSSSNTRMKDKQFHAVISCKGKEFDKHQLTSIAAEYLGKMGYGENPYLIVFHNDTENNHVHVVTSRIDKEGKRINRDFEGKRSSDVIEKILQNDIKLSTNKLVSSAFDYSISTVAQFKLLFEQRGYSASYNDKEMTLRKFNDVQEVIPMEKVNALLADYKRDAGRAVQLKAIINKYKARADATTNVVYEPSKYDNVKKPIGYSSALATALKDKFSLEIIYHGKKGLPPYGYSIIDHSNKTVFKGGEIMPLKEFMDNSLYNGKGKQAEPIHITVDGFKEKEASLKILGDRLGKVTFAVIPKEKIALINVLLKSALHEFSSMKEGLRKHQIELLTDTKGLFVLDKSTNVMIDAKRVLSSSDYALIARRSGLKIPQKEKEIIINTDSSKAYSLKGTLKNHGSANYQFDKEGKPSYFIELLKPDGNLKVVWGIDLERAIGKSGYQIGDTIQLNYKGFNEVQIQVPVKDVQGKTTYYEDKVVKRNDWDITEPDERSLSNSYEGKSESGSIAPSVMGGQDETTLSDAIQSFELSIADDVDDEQINGRNRRRVRKSRVNTR